MSKSLKLDENNNLVFGSNFVLCDGIESLTQDLKTKLDLWKGEFIYNLELGIDYKSLLLNNNIDLLKSSIEDSINDDPRVKSVEITELEVKEGLWNLQAKVTTEEGEVFYV